MTPGSIPSEQGNAFEKTHYHAFWLSDIHLGCKDCKAEFLLRLFENNAFDNLFLVGDIIDIRALKRRPFWPESHHHVLRKIIEIAQTDTNVVFIPGNHDELLKSYHYFNFVNIDIQPFFLHDTIRGKKLLMVHGDQFDSEVCVSRYYARLGDHLYDFILFLNRSLHRLRKKSGRAYWSLAGYIKNKVPKARQAIERYHQAAIRYAKSQHVDVIFCGHIHQPALLSQQGMIYGNLGDWIENCTLIAETETGELQLLRWDDKRSRTQILTQIGSSALDLSPGQQKQNQQHVSVA